jgi:hypothetical protein
MMYFCHSLSTGCVIPSFDVQATINFVRMHNLSLSIKNTGHDFLECSANPNSLALWTHNLNNMEFFPTFSPTGCRPSVSPIPNVGLVAAGVNMSSAVAFFHTKKMAVTVGAKDSVGLAGGFGTGGGHGPLGPKYGLMVDQAIEMDIVTADGQLRTINACDDPDLFTAMRVDHLQVVPVEPASGTGSQADLMNVTAVYHNFLSGYPNFSAETMNSYLSFTRY